MHSIELNMNWITFIFLIGSCPYYLYLCQQHTVVGRIRDEQLQHFACSSARLTTFLFSGLVRKVGCFSKNSQHMQNIEYWRLCRLSIHLSVSIIVRFKEQFWNTCNFLSPTLQRWYFKLYKLRWIKINSQFVVVLGPNRFHLSYGKS